MPEHIPDRQGRCPVTPTHYAVTYPTLDPDHTVPGWACGLMTATSPPGTTRASDVTCRACRRTRAWRQAGKETDRG